MREFDFDHPDFKKHMPDSRDFLLANHDKPITEAEFVDWFTQRGRIHPDGTPVRKASHKRSPSYARHKYQRLVKTYGLFPGGQNG